MTDDRAAAGDKRRRDNWGEAEERQEATGSQSGLSGDGTNLAGGERSRKVLEKKQKTLQEHANTTRETASTTVFFPPPSFSFFPFFQSSEGVSLQVFGPFFNSSHLAAAEQASAEVPTRGNGGRGDEI